MPFTPFAPPTFLMTYLHPKYNATATEHEKHRFTLLQCTLALELKSNQV